MKLLGLVFSFMQGYHTHECIRYAWIMTITLILTNGGPVKWWRADNVSTSKG